MQTHLVYSPDFQQQDKNSKQLTNATVYSVPTQAQTWKRVSTNNTSSLHAIILAMLLCVYSSSITEI